MSTLTPTPDPIPHPLSQSFKPDTSLPSDSADGSTAVEGSSMNGHAFTTFPASGTADTLAPLQAEKFDRFESPARNFPTSKSEGWEEAYERQQRERWREKVDADLVGWRGGNAPPRSGYSKEAVPTNSYYGQPVTGTIGKHLPKEIIRIERDWSEGEVCRFQAAYPMELEGRISPVQWERFVTALNERLGAAYSVRGAVVDNLIAIVTCWTSLLWRTSHFETELRKAEEVIAKQNTELFNPQGLNVLSPRPLALQFLEIEYY